jgi:mono/diheme cytochrome c family protein
MPPRWCCYAFVFLICTSAAAAWRLAAPLRGAFLGVAVSVSSLATAPDGAHAYDLNKGSALFSQSCAGCHAGGGNNFPFAGSKTLLQKDLDANGYATVDTIATIIRTGKGPMLAYGEFVSPKGNVIPARFTDEEMKVTHNASPPTLHAPISYHRTARRQDIAAFVLDRAAAGWQ